jgi:tetratricopeptide (TPR) repeat protein
MAEMPDLDSLWDYQDPAHTEARMRELIPQAERTGDRAYLASLFTQIARAQGLQGNFDGGHATLNRAEPMAVGTSAPRVRMMLERGRLHNSSGDPAAARVHFAQAWQAARAEREEALAVDAAHMLAIVSEGDEAFQWNTTALELAESSADPRARRWRASLLNNLGWTYHDRGDFESARACFERAVPLREAAGDARELRIARWCVARSLRSLGRLEEALRQQRDLLDASQAEGLEPDGFVSEEIGECLQLLGRQAEARPHFAEAFRLLSADSGFAKTEPERLSRLRQLAGTG